MARTSAPRSHESGASQSPLNRGPVSSTPPGAKGSGGAPLGPGEPSLLPSSQVTPARRPWRLGHSPGSTGGERSGRRRAAVTSRPGRSGAEEVAAELRASRMGRSGRTGEAGRAAPACCGPAARPGPGSGAGRDNAGPFASAATRRRRKCSRQQHPGRGVTAGGGGAAPAGRAGPGAGRWPAGGGGTAAGRGQSSRVCAASPGAVAGNRERRGEVSRAARVPASSPQGGARRRALATRERSTDGSGDPKCRSS